MYASMKYHIFPISHYIFSFLFLFLLLPNWLFKSQYVDRMERWLSGFVKMTLLIIISGYLLVVVKLYEVISLLVLYILLGLMWKDLKQVNATSSGKDLFFRKLFDGLDGLLERSSIKIVKKRMVFLFEEYIGKWNRNFSWIWFFECLALITILSISMYLRLYDSFVNAAPPLSDSYVTLAWMKFINSRQLFHDGIYPQGFHIYLATLLKFAAVDALYVLRYTGPLNSFLFMVGMFFVIRKLTKNRLGSFVGCWIYGLLFVVYPFFLIERQAATNSQEFAFVFIFPAVYFLLRYLMALNKEDLYVGLICTTIIGLVHTLAFVLIGLLIGIIAFSAICTLKKRGKQVVQLCFGALLTVVVSLLPLVSALLLGKEFHSSSADYLLEQGKMAYHYPILTFLDFITLGFLLLLIFQLFKKRISNEDRFIIFFTILAGICIFLLYYVGGIFTQSTIIAARSVELWALMIPMCIGIAMSYSFQCKNKNWNTVIYFTSVIVLIAALFFYKPAPVIPYKLEHNENIEQYLKISNAYLPKTWMIVSQEEGYSISLGTGYHMHLGDFLKSYNPKKKALTKNSDGKIDNNVPANIFVFEEKQIFKVSKSNSIYELLEPQYVRRKKEYKELATWMNTHKIAGFAVDIYFENDKIIVYHLETPQAETYAKDIIWRD